MKEIGKKEQRKKLIKTNGILWNRLYENKVVFKLSDETQFELKFQSRELCDLVTKL